MDRSAQIKLVRRRLATTDVETIAAYRERLEHELVSIIEELETANVELRSRNDALERAVQSAERTSAYTTAIVEAVPIPLLVLDETLQVLDVNRAFHRTFEHDGRDALGRRFEELAEGAWNVAELVARLRRVLDGEHVDGFVVEHELAGLGRRVTELHAHPIEWLDGARRLLVAIHDITAHTFAERQWATLLERAEAARVRAQETLDEAERANRTKDVFLATLSHELRTPLTSILLNTERLREAALSPERVARATVLIERAARGQSHLIDDLLDISRVIAHKLHLKREPVDLSALVAAAAESMREAAARRALQLGVSVPPVALTVIGDAGRLQQVVWNLLTNAIKFTPEAGSIAVELSARDQTAVLRVRDSGKGIDPRRLEDVFGLFSQEDGAANRRHGGLGLGLAIVRHLVEAHGGTVSAGSAGLGHGATFTVELPLTAGAALPVATDDLAAAGDLTGLDVLVVEDDDATRELLAEALASRGATLRAAASVAEGLAACLDRAPDLVLCDVAMPERDGYDFVASLRATTAPAIARVPVVAVTAFASEADRQRALAAGFDDHVPKPIDTRRLTAVVLRCQRGTSR